MARDWHAWYGDYDDPESPLSRRLAVVRSALAGVLAARTGPVSLLSLCAGDGRDTLPVLASSQGPVSAVLVELDPDLAEEGRRQAAALGVSVDIRTDDAGQVAAWLDVVPVDVLMLCGVLGNVSDDDARRILAGAALMLQRGGTMIWTRGNHGSGEEDPGEWVRSLLVDAGWEERVFVRPDDASYRVGVHTWNGIASGVLAGTLFSFVP
jgi:hypothetical protein